MSLRKTKLLVLCIVFLFAWSDIARADCGNGDPTVKGMPVQQLVNPEGWQIPGLATGRNVTGRQIVPPVSAEDVPIYSASAAITGKHIPVQIFEYETTSQPGVLIVRPNPSTYFVKSIASYEANGRIFAYQVAVALPPPPPLDAQTKEKIRRGLLVQGGRGCDQGYLLKYYDNDGDGKFETLEIIPAGLGGYSIPPGLPKEKWERYGWEQLYVKVPAWVKQSSAAQAAPPKPR
jgi:hypothetical protein